MTYQLANELYTISIKPFHERSDFTYYTGQIPSHPVAYGASSDIYICEFEQSQRHIQAAVKCYRVTDERKRLSGDDVAAKVRMVESST